MTQQAICLARKLIEAFLRNPDDCLAGVLEQRDGIAGLARRLCALAGDAEGPRSTKGGRSPSRGT